MEEVPQEPITADPREDEEDEGVPEEGTRRAGGKPAESANEPNSGENAGRARARRRRGAVRSSLAPARAHTDPSGGTMTFAPESGKTKCPTP